MIVNRIIIMVTFLTPMIILAPIAWAQMTLHHINVAQGDATLVEFQTAAILIDVGGSNSNLVKDDLIKYLDEFFERRSDLNNTLYSVIITHPHADHLRWVTNILKRYRVLNLVDNGDSRHHGSVKKMKQARSLFRQQKKQNPLTRFYNRIDAADIKSDGYITKFFEDLKTKEPNVEVSFVNASRRCKNPNNDSVVVLIKYGFTKALITGDAEDDEDPRCTSAIPRMLNKFENSDFLDVDVYKAGHHGSHNGTNLPYLEMLSPKISIISAGTFNDESAKDYGHPRMSAIGQMIQHTANSRPAKSVYGFPGPNTDRENFNLSKQSIVLVGMGTFR